MAVIKNINTGEVIFKSDNESFGETVIEAIAQGVSLAFADLRGKNLSGYDFRGVDFSGAQLACADLRGSILDECTFNFTNLSAAKMQESSLKFVRMLNAKVISTEFPDGAALVQSGSGLPYFYFDRTIEVYGFEPKETDFWEHMTLDEALAYGGTRLQSSLVKLQNAIRYFNEQ